MKVFLDSSFLIYLNTIRGDERESIEELFRSLLGETLLTNLLVVDELLYISKRRYGFPYEVTLDFFQNIVLPYTEILPIEETDIGSMRKYLLRYDLKPSDAIHLATMEKAGTNNIATEDERLGKIPGIRRIWL